MIDLPLRHSAEDLIQWLIDNPNEYTLHTYNYTEATGTYTQYYFILNRGYETHITTQEFTSSFYGYINYFVSKGEGTDKNYLTITPYTMSYTVDYGITLGGMYKDVRLVMCFSPKAGQVFNISNGKLISYTASGTGLSNDEELKDFTLDGKQYTYTGYSVAEFTTPISGGKCTVRDCHKYYSINDGLLSQPLGAIKGILVSSTDMNIGKFIKVPINVAKKLLASSRRARNTIYDALVNDFINMDDSSTITTYTSNNTLYARLDTKHTGGYRAPLCRKFELYHLNQSYGYFGEYKGSGTEPGIDIENFVSMTSEDMNTIIVNSGAQQLRELVSALSLNVMREGVSTDNVAGYWSDWISNIIANAIPDIMNIMPKISQITKTMNNPVLDATVYDSTDNSTKTYRNILNSYISTDDFKLHITYTNGSSFDWNVCIIHNSMLTILTVLGFFNPSSTKSVTITKG